MNIQPVNESESMLKVASSREMQEVQAAIFLARQFPRDLDKVERDLAKTCGRLNLAEQAMYAYPRGSELVTGPSIRLAEAIAQVYGNLSFGIRELKQENGESIVQAYAWDMETNVRQEKTFSVPHKRKTKKGTYNLDDPRDIYELVANQGARRVRSCILGVIPGDIVDTCITQCEATVKKGAGEDIKTRVNKMIAAFEPFGITKELIEKRLKHNLSAINETEIVQLSKIYKSIKDGMGKPSEFFDIPADKAGVANDLNEKFSPDGENK